MSAPTAGSAGGSPTPGFYPDPSIPGYIRYWNGAAWVPGTSRPAPAEGEAMPAPPPGAVPPPSPELPTPVGQGGSPAAPATPAVEETGPVFLDEDGPDGGGSGLPPARRGGETEPASAWQADASRQSGFGDGDRVSWGAPDRTPAGAPSPAASWGAVPPQRDEQGADGAGAGASAGAAEVPGMPSSAASAPAPRTPEGRADGTVPIRAVNPAARRPDSGDQGTAAIRAVRPDAGTPATSGNPASPAAPAKGNETMAIRLGGGGRPQSAAPGGGAPQSLPSVGDRQQGRPAAPHQAPGHPASVQPPSSPQPSAAQAPVQPMSAQQASVPPAGFPAQGGAAPGPQGDGAEGVLPWKPPSADAFFAAAQAAQGHPAGLGRRLAARLIDTLVLGAATAAVAVPMWSTVTEHIDAKVEAARQSGRQVTVYLLDGTTAPVLATILAVLLIGGALYEALPVLKWGRTLGKKLCGVRVLDIESHDTPTLGAALKRWFVYSVLGVLVVGVVNAVWCVFDKPWRQCWHDKVARTFVASA
ncbi:RDD family protein [Streptomyces sp. NBRC 110611]|uniref:RDD family protein n=1 Tax=Streptomyces sp. NBRC 110611 TaxID=1621259 RepID=UPI00082B3431|nr:RDD family protein [Streptomyces sp. NBRC 110611]